MVCSLFIQDISQFLFNISLDVYIGNSFSLKAKPVLKIEGRTPSVCAPVKFEEWVPKTVQIFEAKGFLLPKASCEMSRVDTTKPTKTRMTLRPYI